MLDLAAIATAIIGLQSLARRDEPSTEDAELAKPTRRRQGTVRLGALRHGLATVLRRTAEVFERTPVPDG